MAPFILNLDARCCWVVNLSRRQLYPGKERHAPVERGAGWAPELVWTFWRMTEWINEKYIHTLQTYIHTSIHTYIHTHSHTHTHTHIYIYIYIIIIIIIINAPLSEKPSWEADSFSASHKISHILWHKGYHRIHKSLPPVNIHIHIKSTSSQATSWPTLILSHHRCLLLPRAFFFLSDLSIKPTYAFLLPHTWHMPSPFYSTWFDHSDDIWWSVQITDLTQTQFFPATCYFLPHRPNTSSVQV